METQPIQLNVAAEPEAVLAYATQQRRWEHGVLWLVGIVCVTQFLTLPAAVFNWARTIEYWPSVVVRTRWSYSSILLLGLAASLPCFSLVVSFFAFMLLMGARWARVALIAGAWGTVLVALALAVTEMVPILVNLQDHSCAELISELGKLILFCYPLVLTGIVLKRNAATRRWSSAWGIWWLTAGACLYVALPTVFKWLSHFRSEWMRTTTEVFAVFIGSEWWKTFQGIGVISGAMACFSAYLAVVWTLFRGASGRWALMICAALWVVYAAGYHGINIEMELDRYLHSPGAPSVATIWERLEYLFYPALPLRDFAIALAFPLSVRMALSLSDVREKLDGKPAGAGQKHD